MKQTIIILIAALLLFGTAYAGTTGLGPSPFSAGDVFPHTSANAIANANDDNAADIADIVTLSGKAANATHLGTFTGTTIPDSSTIAEALQAIETAYEATLPVAEAYDATDWDGDTGAAQKNDIRDKIESLTLDISDLVTLSGVAEDSTHLGTFAGSTIDDNATIYDAFEDLETAYESTLPVAETYDATGWDGDTGAAMKNDIRDKLESLSFGGDISSVWDVTSGAATRLYQAAIVMGDGDATPDVSAGNVFITANTGATTITDFDTSLVNGQPIWIIVNDALTTFDLTSSGLEGVGGRDYTAASGDLVMGVYSTVDSQWHLLFWPSSIGTVSLQEGIVWADGDGTGSIAWAFATSAARTVTVPGDANITLAYTVASGTSSLGTAEIASGACASVVTTTATGAATTDVIDWGFNGDPTGVTGYAASANGMLTIIAYPSSGNVNYLVCNNTASAITPGAIILNWRIER